MNTTSNHPSHPLIRSAALLLVCALAGPLMGAGTTHWTHTSEADFRQGKFKNVLATNLGDLKLSRAITTLLEQDPKITSVYCLAQAPDGTVYAGTGPQGVLLKISGDKVAPVLTLEDDNIFSLLACPDGSLLIGTGGDKGRIYRLAGPDAKPVEIFSHKEVQYIWRMLQTPDGMIYAATGPAGQVFEIKPDGSSSVLFSCDEHNILSLVSDGREMLYAGTDPGGLVYRINRKTRDFFALFDSGESEVSDLLLDSRGNLYIATAQASDNDDQAPENPQSDKTGRPEGPGNTPPLSRPQPKNPDQPKPPAADPGEPNPIPRTGGVPAASILPPLATPQALFVFAQPADADPDDPPDANPQLPGRQPLPVPGKPQLPPDVAARLAAAAAAAPDSAKPGSGESPEGNAIYRIDPEGFATEVFRQPVMFLCMIEKDGNLIVGTGSDGLVYQINPAADETSVIARVDPKQVTAMLAARDGRILLGMSNVGGIAAMTPGYAPQGTFISPVLDAGQITRFGKVHLQGSLPPDTALTIATRAGNLSEPSEKTWSRWSDEMPATEFLQVPSPSARFFQYRLTFTSRSGLATAVVDEVDIAHLNPNQPPQIKAVKIGAGSDSDKPPLLQALKAAAGAQAPAGDPHTRQITWEATDPNADPLEYTLYFRAGAQSPWILLQDKLKEPGYTWDTRSVADGRYQVRVVASDARANPLGQGRTASRVSNPFVIDNTPPAIGDLHVSITGSTAGIEARIVDRTGTVAGVDYAVDSKDDWQAAAASDKIFDSPEEGALLTVKSLAPGAHQITIRATDDSGNQSYETVRVRIENKG